MFLWGSPPTTFALPGYRGCASICTGPGSEKSGLRAPDPGRYTPPKKTFQLKDFPCFVDFFGLSVTTTKTRFEWSPSGVANMSCHFDE